MRCGCFCTCSNDLTIEDLIPTCRQCVLNTHDPRAEAAKVAADLTLTNGGATLVRETLAPLTPSRGYAVGLVRGSCEVVTLDPLAVAHSILSVWRRFPDATNIGTWVSDGVVCVDPVIVVDDHDAAMELAFANAQEAIYDFATGKDLMVLHRNALLFARDERLNRYYESEQDWSEHLLSESELRALHGDR